MYDSLGSYSGHAPGYGYDLSLTIERNPLMAATQKVRGREILRNPQHQAMPNIRYGGVALSLATVYAAMRSCSIADPTLLSHC
jgi:hypothetical protein